MPTTPITLRETPETGGEPRCEVTTIRRLDDDSYVLVFHNPDIDQTATLMVRYEDGEHHFSTAEGWARISVDDRCADAARQLGDEIERMRNKR